MKKSYISSPKGLLDITIVRDKDPQVTITLDLGIPNFTVFSLKIPVIEDDAKGMVELLREALCALLDELSAFMMSLDFEEQIMVQIYATVLMSFENLQINSTDKSPVGKDSSVVTYEATFPIPQTFVNETYNKVVTGSSIVKRVPATRHIELTPLKKQETTKWDVEKAIQRYRGKNLLNQPKRLFVVVYDAWGKPKGTVQLGPNFRQQTLRGSETKTASPDNPDDVPEPRWLWKYDEELLPYIAALKRLGYKKKEKNWNYRMVFGNGIIIVIIFMKDPNLEHVGDVVYGINLERFNSAEEMVEIINKFQEMEDINDEYREKTGSSEKIDFAPIVKDVLEAFPEATGIEVGGSYVRGELDAPGRNKNRPSDLDIIIRLPQKSMLGGDKLDSLFEKYKGGYAGREMDFITTAPGGNYVGQQLQRWEEGKETPTQVLWGDPYDEKSDKENFLREIRELDLEKTGSGEIRNPFSLENWVQQFESIEKLDEWMAETGYKPYPGTNYGGKVYYKLQTKLPPHLVLLPFPEHISYRELSFVKNFSIDFGKCKFKYKYGPWLYWPEFRDLVQKNLKADEASLPPRTAAPNYEDMFKALLSINPGLDYVINDNIKWAKRILKKQDRIVWFLSWYRFSLSRQWAPQNLTEKYAKDLGITSGFNTWGINVQQKRMLEHYFGIQATEIQNMVISKSQNPVELLEKLGSIESELAAKYHGVIIPRSEDKIVLQFADGWAWWLLPRAYCSDEAKAMGHCGNSPEEGNVNQEILSLRQQKKVGKEIVWEPHCTFIYNKNGYLGEMKGKGNAKPVERYHPYIVELLKLPMIKGIVGGGYKAENNFRLNDLDPSLYKELIAVRPEFTNASGDYNIRHIIEVLKLSSDSWRADDEVFVVQRWETAVDFIQEFDNRYGTDWVGIYKGSETPELPTSGKLVKFLRERSNQEAYRGAINRGVPLTPDYLTNFGLALKMIDPKLVPDFDPSDSSSIEEFLDLLTGDDSLMEQYVLAADDMKPEIPQVIKDAVDIFMLTQPSKPDAQVKLESMMDYIDSMQFPYGTEINWEGLNDPCEQVLPLDKAMGLALKAEQTGKLPNWSRGINTNMGEWDSYSNEDYIDKSLNEIFGKPPSKPVDHNQHRLFQEPDSEEEAQQQGMTLSSLNVRNPFSLEPQKQRFNNSQELDDFMLQVGGFRFYAEIYDIRFYRGNIRGVKSRIAIPLGLRMPGRPTFPCKVDFSKAAFVEEGEGIVGYWKERADYSRSLQESLSKKTSSIRNPFSLENREQKFKSIQEIDDFMLQVGGFRYIGDIRDFYRLRSYAGRIKGIKCKIVLRVTAYQGSYHVVLPSAYFGVDREGTSLRWEQWNDFQEILQEEISRKTGASKDDAEFLNYRISFL